MGGIHKKNNAIFIIFTQTTSFSVRLWRHGRTFSRENTFILNYEVAKSKNTEISSLFTECKKIRKFGAEIGC